MVITRRALVVAAVLSLTACGGPTGEAPQEPASAGPTGAAVTGTYVFVEKDEQTLCDYLDADGKRFHIIYGSQVGHGVLTMGPTDAPQSFIVLGAGDAAYPAGMDPTAYGARPDVIAAGERITGWGTPSAAVAQDPCEPYDQVLTLSALKPA
jgi:hypothetical protein